MRGYQSHETFWNDFWMYFAMVRNALIFAVIVQGVIIYNMFNPTYKQLLGIRIAGYQITWKHFYNYTFNNTDVIELEPMESRALFGGYPRVYTNYYRQRLDQLTNGAFWYSKEKFFKALKISWASYFLALLYCVAFYLYSIKMSKDKFIRGIDLIPIEKLNAKLAAKAKEENKKKELPHITIGDTKIPRSMEPSHFLILGAAGSGKSVLLNQIIYQIRERKEKARTREKMIIYDMKGEFVSKHFEANDLIFSPFDLRTLKWSFFNEIESYPDFDIASKSLFVSTDPRDEYWYNCAKDVFRMGLIYLHQNGRTTNKDLWDFFSQSISYMKVCFEELPLSEQAGLKHIENPESNSSSSIISVLQERIQFFRYLIDIEGDFSFRKFIRDENDTRTVYLLNIEQFKMIFKPLMTFVIDTVIRETLSLPDKLNRRIFFIIDELGSLYKMESILDLLTVGRSKGACLLCANQDLGRIEETYGKSNIKTFYNNFNTNFIFRINEPETAEFLSKALGEKQIIRISQSSQMSHKSTGDRKSFNEQEKNERVILPTEFQNLENFNNVVKISNFGISKMEVPKIFYPSNVEHFQIKSFELGNKDDSDPLDELLDLDELLKEIG
ncbi:MAG TPA: type IV secretion system DNA-binding domain-containing protein [Bacillota bacterium]|nr:type IV secretion system DNA-binding domain-containing protein [Bacillota bacterium]HOL09895.1 type IV secretion system DNA-binding domain-containing protein [Bacillota bacterium]HPO98149.1 type IV secretion system DNA-binding domain-containing protein [Bacillota bacterium]